MNPARTARARARAELTTEIKDAARQQLAQVGADRLSLRAVARELGMVSSALYRYFPSRDDLLTALIVDAYESLAQAAEFADSRAAQPRQRWRQVSIAIRGWAVANPHEYALLYGSPVPGYHAPTITIEPAARIPLALLGIVRDAWTAGTLAPMICGPTLSLVLAEQLGRIGTERAPGIPEPVLASVLVAWTQLFGMLSFELFGQLVGSVDPSEEFFAHAVEQMADVIGLPPA